MKKIIPMKLASVRANPRGRRDRIFHLHNSRSTATARLAALAGLALAILSLSAEAEEDRVGFPKDYRARFKLLSVAVQDREPRFLSAFGNELAASVTNAAGLPYPYGSVLVMEFATTLTNEAGQPVFGPDGKARPGPVHHVDVMRREKGFGEKYGQKRAGEWEFAGYRLDGSYSTAPSQSVTCAACHAAKAGAANDYVFRMRAPISSTR